MGALTREEMLAAQMLCQANKFPISELRRGAGNEYEEDLIILNTTDRH